MRRCNIAVFIDGTGQNRSLQKPEEYTNVVLLHDAVNMSKTPDVIQYRKYIEGVGTRKEESLKGGAWGIGLDERVEEAYAFIYEAYNNAIEDGDEPHIFLFGFSRGAYAARWLASLIVHAGVPKNEKDVRRFFELHRSEKWKKLEESKTSGSAFSNVIIDYVGVWDTVEASVNKSFDIEIAPVSIRSVRHALAMDEWRFKFLPTRFNKRDGVEEVWFPGCHTDIGGGYPERGLARSPLEWIAAGAATSGLVIDGDELSRLLSARSDEVKYHDECVDGGLAQDALWWITNICGEGSAKVFRQMRVDDSFDRSYLTHKEQAPADNERLIVPDTCIAYYPDEIDGAKIA